MNLTLLLLNLALAWLAGSTQAATPGGDSPDSPEYAGDKWESGQNAGKGFLGWNIVTSGAEAGADLGDSSQAAMGINTSAGKAFRLFARGNGNSVEAYRTMDAPLEPGQSLEVQLSVNFRSGNKGVDLRAAGDNQTIFNLNIGSDDYKVNLAVSGNGSLGSEYSNKTVFTLVFTQKDPSGGTWKVSRSGGVTSVHEGNYQGVAAGLKFYVIDTDPSPENELWFNHLKITGPAAAAKP
jgi:hypothetical protein